MQLEIEEILNKLEDTSERITANDIPFLIIRSISDNADDEATINYNEFELRTAKQSAELLNIIIAKMHLILKK